MEISTIYPKFLFPVVLFDNTGHYRQLSLMYSSHTMDRKRIRQPGQRIFFYLFILRAARDFVLLVTLAHAFDSVWAYFLCSKKSPGWHSKTSHILSSTSIGKCLAAPVQIADIVGGLIPVFSASFISRSRPATGGKAGH